MVEMLADMGGLGRRVGERNRPVEGLACVGPAVELSTADEGFVLSAPGVPGARYPVDVLIEARLPEISLSRTADPLLRHLVTTGAARHYDIDNPDGSRYRTDGVAVSADFYLRLAGDGNRMMQKQIPLTQTHPTKHYP